MKDKRGKGSAGEGDKGKKARQPRMLRVGNLRVRSLSPRVVKDERTGKNGFELLIG